MDTHSFLMIRADGLIHEGLEYTEHLWMCTHTYAYTSSLYSLCLHI